MTFYLNDCLLSWNYQKQKIVALLFCEAKFMAVTAATCQALWLRILLGELTKQKVKPVKLFVDYKFVIALMKNLIFHGWRKHIGTRFYFIQKCIKERKIMVEFVRTKEQRVGILSKALPSMKLAMKSRMLGKCDLRPR